MSDVRAIDELFGELIKLETTAERQEYLKQIEQESAELRDQLSRLVAAHEQAGSFLSEEGEAETAIYEQSDLAGSQIGPYKLRERLGAGGMGVVWAAERKRPIRQKVALKVIKPGMDSEQVVARFEAEREVLAMMDHPHIAKVLNAGTTDQGRPYFVMELIHGVPITEYCESRALKIPERLRLFTEVCKAVQHAHQKGIIHRDIKPSNVLVTEHDGTPVPKIIDFGVAKALHGPLTDRSIYTGVFQAIGTLAYMSPEQATISGKGVDTCADVYALGVLLYELLTGTTPVDRHQLEEAAFDEALRMIREEDVPTPSTRISTLGESSPETHGQHQITHDVGKAVSGDLDCIVMKALEKDRNRRYGTAEAFAADINRHLSNEPVEARAPSLPYRLSRLYRRNRLALSVVGIIAFILLITVPVSIFAWLQADQKSQELQQANNELQHEIFLRLLEDRLTGLSGSDVSLGSKLAPWMRDVLAGLEDYNQGDFDLATEHYREARLKYDGSEELLFLQTLELAPSLLSGNHEEFEKRVLELHEKSPQTYLDQLFVGHSFAFSIPHEGLPLVRTAITKRNSFYAQNCLVDLEDHIAQATRDIKMSRQAVARGRALCLLQPECPNFRSALVAAQTTLLGLYRLEGKDTTELQAETLENVKFLAPLKDFSISQHVVAAFYQFQGKEALAHKHWSQANEDLGGFFAIWQAASEVRLKNRPTSLQTLKMARDHSSLNLATYGEALGLMGRPEEAREEYKKCKSKYAPTQSPKSLSTIPESILLAAKMTDEAKTEASKRLEKGKYVAEWERIRLEFVARSASSEKELDDSVQVFLDAVSKLKHPYEQQKMSAYKLIGLRYYAEGRLDNAKEYLRRAHLDVACYLWPQAYWSSAIETLITGGSRP